MIKVKKAFVLKKSEISKKFRVENNNLDLSLLLANSGLKATKIGEIGKYHRNERNRKDTADSVFNYVQISDIDVMLGRIKSYRKFKGSEAPNNARRIMNYGDVLVSTRRPTRGAVVAVPKDFDQQICTVFFTSITLNDWNEVDPFYLALFLRTSLGRFQFQSMITETAYPVISDEDVETLTILYPDIDTQKRIVAEYEDSVNQFFVRLNDAYNTFFNYRQHIENFVLGEEAEPIEIPKFGLTIEEIIEDNGENTEISS